MFPTNEKEPMSDDKAEFVGIKEELATIGLALSIIAMNEAGAGDADERKRHEQASTKALNLLLKRIESL